MKEKVKIFAHLKKELDYDFCLGCGSCVASCPLYSIELEDEGPALKGRCTSCGLCYDQCPQFVSNLELAKQVFGKTPEPDGIGIYEEAYSVRSTDSKIQANCQDGGAVTSLLTSLLDTGYIDGAVVMGTEEEPWNPEPFVAKTREELIECAGTKYSPGAILTGALDAVDLHYLKQMALVGTPCQIKAFRRMQSKDRAAKRISSKVKFTVGLFCMENFPYENIEKIVEKKFGMDLSEVSKFDIDSGKFIVYLDGKAEEEVDVRSLNGFVFTPCKVCADFTSELADVSIGSVGSPSGYSTVILRTPAGVQAFQQAIQSNALEAEPLEGVKPGITIVERVSSSKKRKAEKEVRRRVENGEPLPPRLQEFSIIH